jgi:hypothetical protein
MTIETTQFSIDTSDPEKSMDVPDHAIVPLFLRKAIFGSPVDDPVFDLRNWSLVKLGMHVQRQCREQTLHK